MLLMETLLLLNNNKERDRQKSISFSFVNNYEQFLYKILTNYEQGGGINKKER